MRQLKKRGTASLRVRPDGTVILHVAYDEAEKPKRDKPAVQRQTRKSTLPTLDELRVRADDLGIDISDLGKKRRAIFERLQGAAEAAAEDEVPEVEVEPPTRLVDERTEGESLPESEAPRVIRRRKKATSASEEIDVDDLLEGSA
jgi:hypothetical protein